MFQAFSIKTILIATVILLLAAGCQSRRPGVREEGVREWNAARAAVLHGLASDQFRSGHFDRARGSIEQGLALDPHNGPLLILSAKLAIEQGRLEMAERDLALAREHAPQMAEAFYLSGVIHQRWQQPAVAYDYYTRAADLSPAELAYLLARAEMLVVLDRLPEALAMLRERVVYFEHSAALRDAVGQLLMQQGEYAQAVEMFRQASILASDDLNVRESLALALYHNRQYAEAASLLRRLLEDERYARRFDLLIALGESQMQIGRYREARGSFDAASRVKPTSELAWRSLGKACISIGDHRRADLALRQALSLDPQSAESHLAMGYLRLRQDRLEEALVSFHRAHTLDRTDVVSVCMIGFVLERQGRPEQALRYYGHALRLNPDDEMAAKLMAALVEWLRRAGAAGGVTPPQADEDEVVIAAGLCRAVMLLGLTGGVAAAGMAWGPARLSGELVGQALVPVEGQAFVPVRHKGLPHWSYQDAAVVLLLISALAGAMATALRRREAHRLALALAAERLGDAPLHASRELTAIVSAAQRAVDSARQAAAAAQLKAREAEIGLKVATLERQHAEAVIYSISDAVLVTDTFDELVLANESAARAFGFALGGAGRTPVDRLLRDERMIEMIREMRRSDSATGRRIVEHRVPSGGGDRVYKVTLSCVGSRIASGGAVNGEPAGNEAPSTPHNGSHGVVAVLQDVTHEKEVAQMKNDFVSHVSHELRTPLASIKAYIEMLIDGEAEDDRTREQFYEVIQNESNRLSRLIDNILNISRIESGLVKTNRRPMSLTVILADALEVIAPQAKARQIAIDEQLPPVCYQTQVDRDMMYQVVLNLLSNAVKYTPEGGRIRVEIVLDEGRQKVTTRISDTGAGIPPKDLPFVFDKFYRVEKNNGMAKGTGLGLSLVKQIVETVHGGQIFVQSEVGKGSCFGFELDLC